MPDVLARLRRRPGILGALVQSGLLNLAAIVVLVLLRPVLLLLLLWMG